MSNDEYKNCPFCDGKIKVIALKCRYCESLLYEKKEIIKKSDLIKQTNEKKRIIYQASKHQTSSKPIKKIWGLIVAVLAGGLILLFVGLSIFNNILDEDASNNLSKKEDALIDGELNDDNLEEEVFLQRAFEYIVTVEGENRLHIRENPGIINKPDDDIIGRVYRGHLLEVFDNHGNNIFVDNYTWWEISDPVSGIKGWVVAEYLQKNTAGLENNAGFELRGNTIGNNINQGLVASLGDWLYFSDHSNDWGKIYKINLDGSGKEKLNDNISQNLNVVDDWIYFSNYDDGNKIYRVHIDGNVSEKINNDDSWWLSVVGDWVYYTNRDDNWKIYKVRSDGSGRTKLNDDVSNNINITGDWVYYLNFTDDNANGKVYKVRTDGRDRTRVNEDHSYYINVIEGWVYYSNYDDGSKIYKIRTDGSEREKLNEDRSGNMNVVEDWIFYLNIDDYFKIYKIRTDGSERTMINEDQSRCINIVEDWIYYQNVDDGFKLYKIRTDGSERQLVSGQFNTF
jgi:hypothetical protein